MPTDPLHPTRTSDKHWALLAHASSNYKAALAFNPQRPALTPAEPRTPGKLSTVDATTSRLTASVFFTHTFLRGLSHLLYSPQSGTRLFRSPLTGGRRSPRSAAGCIFTDEIAHRAEFQTAF